MLTEDQRHIRIGKFTGSEIYKLMGAEGLGKIGKTYIYEKAAEFLTGEPCTPEFSSAATTWGNEKEPEAKAHLIAATRCEIIEPGTISNEMICGTPDGIIENAILEIKCPYNSSNHLRNLLLEDAEGLLDLHPEYYWQIVSYLWLMDLKKAKFCSYDPRFKEAQKMLILHFELNPAHLKLLQNRVTEAKLMFNNIISKL
jgi:hypothetical protein